MINTRRPHLRPMADPIVVSIGSRELSAGGLGRTLPLNRLCHHEACPCLDREKQKHLDLSSSCRGPIEY